MSCVDAKFGVGVFGTSRFGTLCTVDDTGGRIFNVQSNITSRKLDLFSHPKAPFKKKIY